MVGDCQTLASSAAWFAAFAFPLNSLLFLFRIRAIFNRSKRITIFFVVLWTIQFGSTMAAPFGVKAAHIEPVESCISTHVANFVSIGPIASWIYDTLIFIAISIKLTSYSRAATTEKSWKGHLQSFFDGREIGQISRVLLQTGQLYYLYV